MYDKTLVRDIVEGTLNATQTIINRCAKIKCMDDFIDDENGQMILDSICMLLIAIGESVKNIDKITESKLLNNYSEIPWKNVTGMRDILSHHYFDINAEIVYNLCQDHIKSLNYTLKQIYTDLK